MTTKTRNLTGQDVDLETSLAEYGLAWQRNEDENEIRFYYGIELKLDPDYNQEYFSGFDWAWLKLDVDIYSEYDWINSEDWFSLLITNGMTKEYFDSLPLEQKVATLLNYYGPENIFGSSYYGSIFTLQELLASQTTEIKPKERQV